MPTPTAPQGITAIYSQLPITLNGNVVDSMEVYLINGNNYFKLRELGEALNFEVKWNEEAKRIEVEMK